MLPDVDSRIVKHLASGWEFDVYLTPDGWRLTGILDWTDTILGDPARDFVDLAMWRGWEFTEEVLRNYHRPIDDGFRARMSFMARLVSTIALTEAHAHGMDVVAYVNGVRNSFAA